MSKGFITDFFKEHVNATNQQAAHMTNELLDRLMREIKKQGRFTIPSFGTFRVVHQKARKAMNPKTQEPIRVKARKTVRFKPSPVLRGRMGK